MKFKFTLHLLLVLIFFSFKIKAQDSSFQLKDYKFRTAGFRSLQVDINLNGGVNNSKFENRKDFKYRSFNTNTSIDYFKITNTEKHQHISNIYLSPSYSSNFNSADTARTKSKYSLITGNWNRIDRFFFKKNTFIEIGNGFYTYGFNSHQSGGNSFVKSESLILQNKLSLGIGKGRMENVQDAQMAMFIINDLRKMGLLQQDLSFEKFNELAKLITEINNRRVFDSRIRRIYELTKIDSFFKANNLVNQPSIAYFTTVNDNWALAFNPGRQAGTVYYFRVKPSVKWEHNENEQNIPVNVSKGSYRTITYAYEPVIGFEKQKPVNLFWQKSMGASLSFVQEWWRSKSDYQSSSNPSQPTIVNNTAASALSFTAFYGVGYYPNNRTIINAGLNLNSFLLINNTNGQKGDFDVKPGLFLNANYFVNYRTRVFLNASSSYYFYNPNVVPTPSYIYQSSRFDTNISLGFSHIIF